MPSELSMKSSRMADEPLLKGEPKELGEACLEKRERREGKARLF